MKLHESSKRRGNTMSWSCFAWIGLTLLLLAAQPVHAQGLTLIPVTSCGQVLGAAGQYVLSADLDCSGTFADGVDITASNVVFHLAGHTLSSTDCDPNKGGGGITALSGLTGVQIEGGTVKGFVDGIVLYSSSSRVNGMTVTGACEFGLAISGQNNSVDTSVVTLSGMDGIGIGAASGIHIVSNNISDNARVGVDISNFSNNNFVENNVINRNGIADGEQGGVAIFNGSKNLIANNTLNNNFNGIELESPGNTARNNTVNGSVDGGVFVLQGASPSSVKSNTVLGSGLADMADGSPKCGKDKWKMNIFQTDLVAGVSDGGPGVGCLQ